MRRPAPIPTFHCDKENEWCLGQVYGDGTEECPGAGEAVWAVAIGIFFRRPEDATTDQGRRQAAFYQGRGYDFALFRGDFPKLAGQAEKEIAAELRRKAGARNAPAPRPDGRNPAPGGAGASTGRGSAAETPGGGGPKPGAHAGGQQDPEADARAAERSALAERVRRHTEALPAGLQANWLGTLALLAGRVNDATYKTHLRHLAPFPLYPDGPDGDGVPVLELGAASAFTLNWLRSRFTPTIEGAAREAFGLPDLAVRFRLFDGPAEGEAGGGGGGGGGSEAAR